MRQQILKHFIMNSEPLVSCVIPTFNRSAKIGNAVKSILQQTYVNFEVLVVDDQSVDDTKQVVEKFAESDSRIKYLFNPQKGANNARNYGISNSRGQYVAFLDDDDIWLETKLEKQVNIFNSLGEEFGVVYCPFERIKPNGKVSKRHPSKYSVIKNGNILNRLLKRNFIGTPAIIVKREVFQKSGMFNPTLKSYQDWELLIRIARDFHFHYINEVLVNVYESEDSITLDKKGRVMTSFRILKQNMDLYEKNKHLLSQRYCTLGFTLLKLKYNRAAKLFLFRSLKHNPLNIEALLFLLVVNLMVIPGRNK